MVGPTLIDIRQHIEGLAARGGRYYVVCGRTGDRPVPAAGNRFPDRGTARAAARSTEQYRSALRRYDPRLPYYDLIVCEETPARTREATDGTTRSGRSDPAAAETPARRALVEFCHRAAGAVFETLSEAGYDAAENAVMEAYFEVAETVDDPDELCLCLLENAAREIDDRLGPAEQAELLTGAAARLGPPDGDTGPLAATLATLDRQGVIDGYTHSPWVVDLGNGSQSAVVRVSDYALSARGGRLPVLPITLELVHRQSELLPRSVRAVAVDDGWELLFDPDGTAERGGVVSAPIEGGSEVQG
jgi:hypothetical protein